MSAKREIPPTPKTEMTKMTKMSFWSDEMKTLQEVLARARMRRAPGWRVLPYRPARQVAADARRYR